MLNGIRISGGFCCVLMIPLDLPGTDTAAHEILALIVVVSPVLGFAVASSFEAGSAGSQTVINPLSTLFRRTGL